MPIDLYSTVGKVRHTAFGSSILNGLLGSTLMASLVLSVVFMIFVLAIYPVKKNTPKTYLLKVFIYVFMAALVLVFLHDGIVKFNIEQQFKDNAEEEAVQDNNSSMVYGAIPVQPNNINTYQTQQTQYQQQTQQTQPSGTVQYVNTQGQQVSSYQGQGAPSVDGAREPDTESLGGDIVRLGGNLYGGKPPAVGGNPYA